MSNKFQSSQQRIDNRVITMYSDIKNNPAFYNNNSYFASAITTTTQNGDIYTARITSYGDQNTAANGRQDSDWMSYRMSSDYNTYTIVDAQITGIADNWATYVNTPPYYIIMLARKYISLKNSHSLRVGMGNAAYTIVRKRHTTSGGTTRLYYSYSMLQQPTMMEQIAYIPMPAVIHSDIARYVECSAACDAALNKANGSGNTTSTGTQSQDQDAGCVGDCGKYDKPKDLANLPKSPSDQYAVCVNACNAIVQNIQSTYTAFVNSAKIRVQSETSPAVWELLGLTDSGEDYIDIDVKGNIISGQFTYWGIPIQYNPKLPNIPYAAIGGLSYYENMKNIKKNSAQYLRHKATATNYVLSYISDGTIGTLLCDLSGNIILT